MNTNRSQKNRLPINPWARSNRAGLSALEFVGCLMALVGGVWLGALYLGVDVRHVVFGTLAKSKVMDQVPKKSGAERSPSSHRTRPRRSANF